MDKERKWRAMGNQPCLFDCAKGKQNRGASAVELAVLAPFLILLLFGVVESSWFLARSLDIAQAAREAGRMAGVNDGDTNTIVAAVCDGMDQPTGARISLSGAASGLGGTITATAEQAVGTITGLLDPIFSPPVLLSHTTVFRLEQTTATWADTTNAPCP
jgi:Flp pilus assembly protein TadG